MSKQHNRMWRLMAIASLVLLALVVIACQTATPAPAPAAPAAKTFTIGLSDFSQGNSWRVQMVAEAQYAASKNSAVKQLIVTEANDSVEKQIADIDDLISKKVDAILITAANPDALVPAVEKAMKAGIVVVDFDNLTNTDNITSHVEVDQKEFGRLGAEFLVKKMGEKGNIIAFNGMKGTQISADRYQGAADVFAKYPNIKIVQEVYADWDYAKAKRAMEDLLTKYPKLEGVWSQGGAMSEAVLATYLEKNMEPPPVTGEDGNGFLKVWKQIRDDKKYPNFDSIAASMPTWVSAKAIEVAVNALQGKAVEKHTKLPVPTITGATLDQYVKPDLPNSYWCNSQLPADIVLKIFSR